MTDLLCENFRLTVRRLIACLMVSGIADWLQATICSTLGTRQDRKSIILSPGSFEGEVRYSKLAFHLCTAARRAIIITIRQFIYMLAPS